MNCCKKVSCPQYPWNGCVGTAVSFEFRIDPGCEGIVNVIRLPENRKLCFEQRTMRCCNKIIEWDPVVDPDCGCCDLCVCDRGKVTLCPGVYRMTYTDCDDVPIVPDEGELSVHVNQI